jgi:lactoylglutathione lyase
MVSGFPNVQQVGLSIVSQGDFLVMRKRIIVAACIAVAVSLVQSSSAQTASVPSGPVVEPSVLDHMEPDHATISVQDLDKERDWYMKVFGFKVLKHMTNPTSEVLMMKMPGYRIDLLKQQGSSRPPAKLPQALQQGWLHVVFSVPPSEVEQALEVLKARGTDVKPSTLSVQANAEHKGAIWLLQLHDPEGNELEIVARGQ